MKKTKAVQKEKIKSLTSKDRINEEINFLKRNNIFFKYTISNYTTTIETAARIIKFNDSMMSKKAFIAYQMICKDLREYTANEMPEIKKYNLQYFETYLKEPLYLEECFLIDIKSAYATILFNDGFISQKTFNFINLLPKKARLAAVGMLASRKDVFYFQGAENTGHDKIINPHENYFWYCVQRTGEIMAEIKNNTEPLFYWVDGIYLKNREDLIKASKILEAEKYNYSVKKIFSFICKTKDLQTKILNNISFYQSKTETEYKNLTKQNSEFKTFSIPVKNKLKTQLINKLMYE